MELKSGLPKITDEVAEKYRGARKGRIPKAIAKQVTLINRLKNSKLSKKKKRDLGITPNTEAFLEEFLKNGGNANDAAMKVGHYTSRVMASKMATRYLNQAQNLARLYLDETGFTYGKLIDVAAEKMLTAKSPDWWDRLMKLADYHDFISKKDGKSGVNVNVIQAHKNFTSEYIDGDAHSAEDAEVVQDEDQL